MNMEEAAQEAHDTRRHTHRQTDRQTDRQIDTHTHTHTHTHPISLSPFTHLFIYGYLDWKLQALPSSALTLLLSDALWMTACLNVATKLRKAVLSALALHSFKKWKERENTRHNGLIYFKEVLSASVALQMSTERMCCVNTERTFSV